MHNASCVVSDAVAKLTGFTGVAGDLLKIVLHKSLNIHKITLSCSAIYKCGTFIQDLRVICRIRLSDLHSIHVVVSIDVASMLGQCLVP